MAVQRTLAIVKPDGVMKNVMQAIKERYVAAGLRIIREQHTQLNKETASELYAEHAGKFYFEGLVLSMVSGQSALLILEGENAVQVVRELNGATDPVKAAEGTIRHDFRSAGGPFNTVHGSDSLESARRECEVVFGVAIDRY